MNNIDLLNRTVKGKDLEIKNLTIGFYKKDEFYHSIAVLNNISVRKISELYSDFLTIQDNVTATYLKNKKRPAYKESYRIEECKTEKRKYIEQYKIMLYKYELLLNIFPELSVYIDDFEYLKHLSSFKTVCDFKEEYDKVRDWVSKDEYLKQAVDERNQCALNRYFQSSKKTLWQIGRDYEMYCGYKLRKEGLHVIQFGIEQKLEDMGRDIIAQKGNDVYIIQCKRWNERKIIHEKHIAQLYGSAIEYSLGIDLFINTHPIFISNIELSNTAQRFAKKLGVKVFKWDIGDYPSIKCNINNGNKIYHLPFDQQYDKTKIENEGEFYAWTVKEAVDAGFRRAYKYSY